MIVYRIKITDRRFTRFIPKGMILLLILFSCVRPDREAPEESLRPHVLLIFTDQQHHGMMSAMGNPHLQTPAMDRLAENGILFTEAYCTSPVCGPARSSMISGRMPHETGVEWNGNSMKEGIPNAGHLFREAGYRTVWAGKWHLPASYPQRRSTEEEEPISGFEMLRFYDPEARDWLLGATTDPPLTRAVVEFLDNYQDERPLFMGLSYHNPHDICIYPRRMGWEPNPDGNYEVRPFGDFNLPEAITTPPDSIGVLPPLPPNFEINPREPEFLQIRRTLDGYGDELKMASGYSLKDWKGYYEAYCRLTEMVDAEIGTVLDALERNGMLDHTIILFTSDHGDGAAAHRWAAKLSLYEEAAKVPMILSWPGKIPGNRVDDRHLVSQIDILPTLLDYAGVEPAARFTGMSLRPVIEDPETRWREYLVVELADYKPDSTRKGRMVRTMQYKYNVFSEGKRNEQLFDLRQDPGETQNLAGEPSMRSIKAYHQRKLVEWMDRTDDDFQIIDGEFKIE